MSELSFEKNYKREEMIIIKKIISIVKLSNVIRLKETDLLS